MAEFSLQFGDAVYQVMGDFDRARLDEELTMAEEMIAEMGSWPWPGTLRDVLEQLATEAYAYGRTVRAGDSLEGPNDAEA